MPKFINTRGRTHVSIAICDRCHMKKAYDELSPDPDNPGLRVCAGCQDGKDPYKLVPRQTEKIALRYPRPEQDISTTAAQAAEDVGGAPGSVILPDGTPAPTPTPVDDLPPVVLPDVTPLPPVVLPPTPAPPPVYVPPPAGSGSTPIPTGPGGNPTPGPGPSPGPTPTPPGPSPTPPVGADPKPTLSQSLIDEFCGDMCFREDFNGTTLDANKWQPTMPNETENQSFFSYANPNFSVQNWEVANSKLRIWPLMFNSSFFRKTFSTADKFWLRNGIWEAKLRLPRGKGCWPAFWLYNSDTQVAPIKRPEIDIMEAYPGGATANLWGTDNYEPNNFGFTVWDAPWNNGTQDNLAARKLSDFYALERLDTAFHTYTVKVQAGKIRMWFDNKEIGPEVTGGSMDERYYIILNLWYGSASGEPNILNTPQGPSNAYEIEYVYAWKLKDGSSTVAGTMPAYVPAAGSNPTPTPPGGTPGTGGTWPFGRNAADFSALVFQDEFTNGVLDSAVWTSNLTNYDIDGGFLRQWPVDPFEAITTHTKNKQTREYGYWEFDFRAPRGHGLKPTFGVGTEQFFFYFQMYPGRPTDGWANSAYEPIDFSTNVYSVGQSSLLHAERQANQLNGAVLSSAPHKYAVEYTASHIKFFFDGVEVGSYNHNGDIVGPASMFMDLQYHTEETSPGSGTPTGQQNAQRLDYARIWSFSGSGSTPGSGSGPTPTPPGPTPTPPGPTPTPAPSVTPYQPYAGNIKLFHNDSFWYKEIPTSATLHSNTTGLKNELVAQLNPPYPYTTVEPNTTRYSATVYVVDSTAPTRTVIIDDPSKPGDWEPDPALVSAFQNIHFPTNMQTAEGDDGEAVIYDVTNDKLYEFWQLRNEGGQWKTSWGGMISNVRRDNGIYTGFWGAAASGLPYLAGQITADELRAGHIDHVIGFSMINPGSGWVWPAQRTDGNGSYPIKEGHRFRINPSLNVDALDIHPVAKIIAKAGQKYGFVVWDRAGALSIRLQNPKSYEGQADPYSGAGGLFNGTEGYQLLTGFPWDQAQFLPDNYGQGDSPADGAARTDVTTPTTPTPTPPSNQPQVYPFGQNSNLYTLPVFWDEFDGTSLDMSKWNNAIWYESSHPTINYKVSNGSLKIWPVAPFVNRTIDTDGKFTFLYGYAEVEAKLNRGRGVWPAFWLFQHIGGDPPNGRRPEIDVMEAWPGGGPDTGWGTSDLRPDTYAWTVWRDDVTRVALAKLRDYLGAEMLDDSFHIYGVKWESDGCTFYFDGVQMGPKAFYNYTAEMYVMLDLWFGNASGTPNTSETPQGESNSYEIKYVRVWKFK